MVWKRTFICKSFINLALNQKRILKYGRVSNGFRSEIPMHIFLYVQKKGLRNSAEAFAIFVQSAWSIFMGAVYMWCTRTSTFDLIQLSVVLSPLWCLSISLLEFSPISKSFEKMPSSTSWLRKVKIPLIIFSSLYSEPCWLIAPVSAFALHIMDRGTPSQEHGAAWCRLLPVFSPRAFSRLEIQRMCELSKWSCLCHDRWTKYCLRLQSVSVAALKQYLLRLAYVEETLSSTELPIYFSNKIKRRCLSATPMSGWLNWKKRFTLWGLKKLQWAGCKYQSEYR